MSARVLLLAMALLASQAGASCRQALALGLDVSGSVDAVEYRLQLDGLAYALRDPGVEAAFFAIPDAPVRLMVFEWSGMREQRVIVDWADVNTPADLARIATRLRDTRASAVKDPATAIANAMLFGAEALARQGDCAAHTLDLSGDGAANIGAHPMDIEDDQLGDLVINGLIIGADTRANTTKNLHNVKSLEEYYAAFVLRGPGAFTELAQDYPDFQAAMTRKLIREIGPPALSHLTELE